MEMGMIVVGRVAVVEGGNEGRGGDGGGEGGGGGGGGAGGGCGGSDPARPSPSANRGMKEKKG